MLFPGKSFANAAARLDRLAMQIRQPVANVSNSPGNFLWRTPFDSTQRSSGGCKIRHDSCSGNSDERETRGRSFQCHEAEGFMFGWLHGKVL